jgi:hypothetical protein
MNDKNKNRVITGIALYQLFIALLYILQIFGNVIHGPQWSQLLQIIFPIFGLVAGIHLHQKRIEGSSLSIMNFLIQSVGFFSPVVSFISFQGPNLFFSLKTFGFSSSSRFIEFSTLIFINSGFLFDLQINLIALLLLSTLYTFRFSK